MSENLHRFFPSVGHYAKNLYAYLNNTAKHRHEGKISRISTKKPLREGEEGGGNAAFSISFLRKLDAVNYCK